MNRLYATFSAIVWLCCGLMAAPVWAMGTYDVCTEIGDVTINEVYDSGQKHFVEVRQNDPSISMDDLFMRICTQQGNQNSLQCTVYDLEQAENNSPYYVLDPGDNILKLEQNANMDIVIFKTVSYFFSTRYIFYDYLSINEYDYQQPSCSFVIDTTIQTNSQYKGIERTPDGTGEWEEIAGPGNHDENTEGETNDADTVGPDHFEFIHDGNALTCMAEQVTLKACANADCDPYVGEVDVILSDIGWVDGRNQTLDFPADGSVAIEFHHTTAETVTLAVVSSNPEAGGVICSGGSEDSCEIAVANSGFLWSLTDLTSCGTQTASIQAVELGGDGESCVGADGFKDRDDVPVNFWAQYLTPDTGVTAVKIDDDPIVTVAAADSSNGEERTLNFNENALAEFTVNYDDAGKVKLSAKYSGIITDYEGNVQTLTLEGSDSFVNTPAALYIYSPNDDNDCDPASAVCSVFKKAGEVFDLNVRAVCGPIDGDLSDNTKTPNFRLDGIMISSDVVAPDPGEDATVAVNSFDMVEVDSGEHSINQAVSEVGVFTFTTPELTYLLKKDGTNSNIPSATSANIGRFTPDHFIIESNTSSFANRCSSFTYMGQPFYYATPPEITITAVRYDESDPDNVDHVTKNYQGKDDNTGFWKLGDKISVFNPEESEDVSSFTYADNVEGASFLISPATAINYINTETSGGTQTVFFHSSDQFIYSRPNSLVAPFDPDIQLTVNVQDKDGVVGGIILPHIGAESDSFDDIAGEDDFNDTVSGLLRFGRVVVGNAHGSEFLPLQDIEIRTEYYDGSVFVWNTDDNCTEYNAADIDWSAADYPDSDDPLDASMLAASGNSTLSGGSGVFSIHQHDDTTMGPGVIGTVDYHFPVDSWLQYDWDNADEDDDPLTGQDNPTARATFGIYKGSESIIYLRETTWR
ncbi:MAG: hypothetical protein RBR22_11015 [Desulfuromonas sp.]|nr:hypothetical protein [Desulfuromonas sp.]